MSDRVRPARASRAAPCSKALPPPRSARWQCPTSRSAARTRHARSEGGTLRAGFVGGGTAETLNPFLGVTPIDECAHPEPLRPARDRQRRPHAQPGPRARVDAQQGRDRLGGQAAPGRHVPQRQDVRRRGRDLVDPADGRQDERRAAVRLGHQAGRAEGRQQADGAHPAQGGRRRPRRATSPTTTRGSSPRARRPRTTRSRSAPARSWRSRSRPAGRACSPRTRTTGSRASRTSTRSRSRRSTTTPRASTRCSRARSTPWRSCRRSRPRRTPRPRTSTSWWRPSPQAMMFYMDTTKAPFTDPRVTLAIKLIADRKALVESAISGYGTVGNDIFGAGLPFYDKSLPQREQDIDKAKSLLKAAGQSDLKIQLNTSADLPGLRRGGDAARAAGQAGRRDDEPQAGAAELLLQPVAAVPEDAVRRDAVADLVAQVLLPAGARDGRAVQRDALEVEVLERPARQGRSPSPTRPRRSRSGTRCRRSSTTRAATSTGRTPTGSTGSPRRCRASSRAPPACSATTASSTPGSPSVERRHELDCRGTCCEGPRGLAACSASWGGGCSGAVVALFAASLVIFAGTQLLPGNAASVVLGRNGNPATVKLLNQQLHLDRPAWQQYRTGSRGSSTAISATRRSAWRRAPPARRSGR